MYLFINLRYFLIISSVRVFIYVCLESIVIILAIIFIFRSSCILKGFCGFKFICQFAAESILCSTRLCCRIIIERGMVLIVISLVLVSGLLLMSKG